MFVKVNGVLWDRTLQIPNRTETYDGALYHPQSSLGPLETPRLAIPSPRPFFSSSSLGGVTSDAHRVFRLGVGTQVIQTTTVLSCKVMKAMIIPLDVEKSARDVFFSVLFLDDSCVD